MKIGSIALYRSGFRPLPATVLQSKRQAVRCREEFGNGAVPGAGEGTWWPAVSRREGGYAGGGT